MIVRLLNAQDVEKVREIWERYYSDEFGFEEFKSHFFQMFAVVDDKDRIITAGGIRSIAEAVIVTDKAFSTRQKREALLKMLEVGKFLSIRYGFTELHATAQDKKWEDVLRKYNFHDPKGKFLTLGLYNG